MDTSTLSDEQKESLKKLFKAEAKKEFFWNAIKTAGTYGAIAGTFVAAAVVTKGFGDFVNSVLFGND